MSSVNLLNNLENQVPSLQAPAPVASKKRKEASSESPSSMSAILDRMRKQNSKAPLSSASSLQNSVSSPRSFTLKRKKEKSVSADKENSSPVPGSPMDYHYEDFYEEANDQLLSKVFRAAKGKEFQTIGPADSRKDAEILQTHYGQLTEKRKKSLARPSPVKAGADTSIEILSDGYKVSRKDSTRTYKVHESKAEGKAAKWSFFPHTGDGFVTVAGSELEDHVRTYKRESPKDVKFLKYLELRVGSGSRPSESPSPVSDSTSSSSTSLSKKPSIFSFR